MEPNTEFLKTKIIELRVHLGVRAINALSSRAVKYVWQLAELNKEQLKEFDGLGDVGIAQIEFLLNTKSCSLDTFFPEDFKRWLIEETQVSSIKDSIISLKSGVRKKDDYW